MLLWGYISEYCTKNNQCIWLYLLQLRTIQARRYTISADKEQGGHQSLGVKC